MAATSGFPATPRLTHQLFRFPAKFHPPVARQLIEQYSSPSDRLLDPFCGSGTLLVEAVVSGRAATGTDVDPLAVFVSSVKSRPLRPNGLEKAFSALCDELDAVDRGPAWYRRFESSDIAERTYRRQAKGLRIPAIPNIGHWFRRYVIIDLAHIRDAIEAVVPVGQRPFFRLALAAIVRNASNADPVPVSGLEVTAHMRRREQSGRIVDPFELFLKAAGRSIDSMSEFHSVAGGHARAEARRADVTSLSRVLKRSVDCVITSPPYHGAVDYYRRHTLEMYWMDLTSDRDERLQLLNQYIGRPRVPQGHAFVQDVGVLDGTWTALERRMSLVSRERADAFRHYCVAMHHAFREIAQLLISGSPAVFVVGHSEWNGARINTSELFTRLSQEWFVHRETWSYRVQNRYMSYARKNGADINREHVLVFERR
jgi:hypothetical protein